MSVLSHLPARADTEINLFPLSGRVQQDSMGRTETREPKATEVSRDRRGSQWVTGKTRLILQVERGSVPFLTLILCLFPHPTSLATGVRFLFRTSISNLMEKTLKHIPAWFLVGPFSVHVSSERRLSFHVFSMFSFIFYQGSNFKFLHLPSLVLLKADLPDGESREQSNHLLKPLWTSLLWDELVLCHDKMFPLPSNNFLRADGTLAPYYWKLISKVMLGENRSSLYLLQTSWNLLVVFPFCFAMREEKTICILRGSRKGSPHWN